MTSDLSLAGVTTTPPSQSPPTSAVGRRRFNWFSDLKLTRRGFLDTRTGHVVGVNELTPGELARFLAYFAVVVAEGAAARRTRPRQLRIWFEPERPPPWYVAWSAVTLAGFAFARDPAEADVRFYFEDKTVGSAPRGASAMINGACVDISKSRVARVFGEVAGYALCVDPASHCGVVVEKGEENGVHDGRLVACPMTPRDGKSYQRFVDCSDGVTATDYRTTIIDRRPIYVLEKRKPADSRFSIHNDAVLYREVGEIFSAAEVDLLVRFAEAMALDWAAIDVLRDRRDGRIYVVDVNKTDTGPAVDLNGRDRGRLKRALTAAFSAMARERAGRA